MPTFRIQFEPLEPRELLATGPAAREQYMLELINRLRISPGQQLSAYLASKDPDIQNALRFFKVNKQVLANQWAGLNPVAPLAWNDALARAAKEHNQKMLSFDKQSHQFPGEPTLLPRVSVAGYSGAQFVGENVFAFMESVEHGHVGFAIDWGTGPNGIQSPPGHRDNIMSGAFRDVGLSIIDSSAGKKVGPMLVTQNFGAKKSPGNAFLLGVIYDDKNKDACYGVGEGLEGATIIASGKAGTFATTSFTAGGYQMQLPPGTYTLTASGGATKGIATIGNVTIANANIKRDFIRANFNPETALPTAKLNVANVTTGGHETHEFTLAFTDNAAVDIKTLSNGDVKIGGPNGFSQPAQLVGLEKNENGQLRTARYRFTAPGGFFDSADNGAYVVDLAANQVADTNANFAPAARLGSFNVAAPLAVLKADGTFVVNGTPANDDIQLSLSGANLLARVNAVTQSFNFSSIKRIFAAALFGNDKITLAPNLMGSTLDGGPGNDTITGTAGPDTLQGQDGDDILYGLGGHDLFISSPGNDTIFGGRGTDTAKNKPGDTFTMVERWL